MTEPHDLDEFLPTRQSLLSRLRDWEDHEGWAEFFERYSGFILGVLRRSGLAPAEAEDVAQEILVSVARQMPAFCYDPSRGSFKTWLHTVIRSRLLDHLRKRRSLARVVAPTPAGESGTSTETEFLARVADESGADRLDAVWQSEWEQGMLRTALRRVRARVSARQFLIFSLATLKETPVSTITRKLDLNVAQVYLAKHRVGKLVKAELARLREESE